MVNNHSLKTTKENESDTILKIINQYKPFVMRSIHKYVGEFDEDLYQECMIAIMNAIKRFKPDKNVKFFTYLYHVLEYSIKEYMRRKHLIKTPRYIPASTKEGIDYLVSNDGKLYFELVHIDDSLDDTGELFVQIPYVEKSYDRIELKYLIKTLLDQAPLTDSERKVILLRYGLEDGIIKTTQEVANILHLSRQRVNQLELRALRKLKAVAIRMGVKYDINS